MIQYIQGDLFDNVLVENETVFIPHVCNDEKLWRSGFVVPLSQHYPEAKKAYHLLNIPDEINYNSFMVLGHTGYTSCSHADYRTRNNIESIKSDKGIVVVANMIAQQGVGFNNGIPPIRYEALKKCMEDVKITFRLQSQKSRICCPKFGSGLAGGEWNVIENMILEIWKDIPVYVYFI